MVAISQAPSPESNPNSPLPVISLVSPYLTIHLIGQSFVWFIAAPSRPRALLRFATIFPLPPHCCEGKKNILLFVFVPCCVVQKVRTSSSHKASLLHSQIGFSLFWLPRLWVHFSYFPLMPPRGHKIPELTNAIFTKKKTASCPTVSSPIPISVIHVLALQLTGLSFYCHHQINYD